MNIYFLNKNIYQAIMRLTIRFLKNIPLNRLAYKKQRSYYCVSLLFKNEKKKKTLPFLEWESHF